MNIKSGLLIRLLPYGVILMLGIMSGIIVQKYLGLGNILRSAGVSYPTRTPPVGTSTPVIVEIPHAYQGRMQLFILAGQSNMVGWAPIPDGEPTDPRIFVFGKDYRWRIASHPIEDATGQVDMVSENRLAGFGPAMDFAFASLERHPDIIIGLIPCAKNSSGIIQWQRDLSDQTLYGSCLKRALAASSMGEISGMLFFQGETDAVDPFQYPDPPPHPSEWAELFTAFVSDLRDDLNQPNLPVVFAQIGSTWAPEAYPNWDFLMEQQASLQLPGTAMITTADLPLYDGIHYATDSYRIIGRRFAEAYWDLAEQP